MAYSADSPLIMGAAEMRGQLPIEDLHIAPKLVENSEKKIF